MLAHDYKENQNDKEAQLDFNYGNGELVTSGFKMAKAAYNKKEYKPQKFQRM